MSGIYIKNMDMPTSCNECRFAVDGFCYAYPKQANGDALNKRERTNWCPLVPVPDHGDLIDRNALYEKFARLESEAMSALQTTSLGSIDGIKWSAILTERTGYKFDVADAPAIIPAHKEETE